MVSSNPKALTECDFQVSLGEEIAYKRRLGSTVLV